MFTIHLDNHKFMLSSTTLKKFPASLLYRIIYEHTSDPLIVKEAYNIYIDRDPLIFTYVIDTYRGYQTDIEEISDKIKKANVLHDLKYFGLLQETISIDILSLEQEADGLIGSSSNCTITPETLFRELLEMSHGQNSNVKEQSTNPKLNSEELQSYVSQITEQLEGENAYNIIQEVSNNDKIKELINQNKDEESESDVDDAEIIDLDE